MFTSHNVVTGLCNISEFLLNKKTQSKPIGIHHMSEMYNLFLYLYLYTSKRCTVSPPLIGWCIFVVDLRMNDPSFSSKLLPLEASSTTGPSHLYALPPSRRLPGRHVLSVVFLP